MRVLILVDIQNDFCPGGALAVPKGDEVVAVANSIKNKFPFVIATQDWHPQAHGSFASNHPGKKCYEMGELAGSPQVLWPDHCVNGTVGAQFHPSLNLNGVTIFQKGTDVGIDSYSGFFDNGRKRSTGLQEFLETLSTIDSLEVYVMGLATDYCVKATALDSIKAGFKTYLIDDGCRGVNIKDTDVTDAIAEMLSAGVLLTTSEDI